MAQQHHHIHLLLKQTKTGSIQTGTKEFLAVNYMELIPVLIKALQEEDAKNKALEERLVKQEEKIPLPDSVLLPNVTKPPLLKK